MHSFFCSISLTCNFYIVPSILHLIFIYVKSYILLYSTLLNIFTFILFCSTYERNGCQSGQVVEAFKYVHNNGGITTDKKYPKQLDETYTSVQTCDLTKSNYSVTVEMNYRLRGENDMVAYVLSGGTLAVDIDASTWSNYQSGVYSGCPTKFEINHAVNIVGVNVTGKYWIVRNSWGTEWGEMGFMKLELVSTGSYVYTCVCMCVYL